jgi:hypothetical protein
LYAGDNGDSLPTTPNTDALGGPNSGWTFYKRLVRSYAGLSGPSSPQDKLFACPCDTFYYTGDTGAFVGQSRHDQSYSDYSSYAYNGLGGTTNPPPTLPGQTETPGLFGWKLASIKDPVKTTLVYEFAASYPYSYHDPHLQQGQFFNDARNILGFADGHLRYIKIYWNSDYSICTRYYDPPASYEYKWSGD